jgi:hypothetical protein
LIITNRSYTSLFIEEGGWTLYSTEFRANSANLANKHSTKLGTLIYSAHARTVRPTCADCLSGLRAGSSARSFWCQTSTKVPFSSLPMRLCSFSNKLKWRMNTSVVNQTNLPVVFLAGQSSSCTWHVAYQKENQTIIFSYQDTHGIGKIDVLIISRNSHVHHGTKRKEKKIWCSCDKGHRMKQKQIETSTVYSLVCMSSSSLYL